ncbi:MAG: cytochrome c peroxidase [Ferruginibacter sp.]
MLRQLLILGFLAFLVAAFSFKSRHSSGSSNAQVVKSLYFKYAADFSKEAAALNKLVKKGDEKKIQQQFLKTRKAYKQIELFAQYWFTFYAEKLNGPPIPYFEEEESDMPVQDPSGLQLIESWIYPHINRAEKDNLELQASEVLRYSIELPQVNESFAFDDNNIFDAIMEQLYRITTLGISGFDSQLAFNSLPECRSSLFSIQQVLRIYKEDLDKHTPTSFASLDSKLSDAQKYLELHTDFNAFNRMEFIRQYLDPITISVGRFKTAMAYVDNPAGPYYSAIKKNNSLFTPGAFNPYRFLDDNTSSPDKIELGRKLFYEKGLSKNGNRSCASCHIPGKAFTDGLKTSVALDGHSPLPRNAPTIWNVGLLRSLFVDSRSRNLEEQVMQVLNNAKEMHGSAKETAEKIIQQDAYKSLYDKAFPGQRGEKAAENICNAIASYERTLIALNARFDRHMNGKGYLSKNEINGFNLFMGKAKCGTCHFMPLFSGAKPPRFYYIESEVLGVPANATAKPAMLDKDSGRYLYSGSPVHLFAFKTPSLRNVALTAPYMHNGVFRTLEEVIDFYNNGGGKGLHIAPANQSLSFDKLNLTKKERTDLVLFMRTLTDTSTVY